MKNKVYYFVLFIILSVKIHAQTSKIVYVYDTIVVHDTIIVYDTIKVNDNSQNDLLKNNIFLQNAVLAIDTSTSKAQLILFNQKDTATISINNIIVSDNNKNLETMKKLILTMAASGLLLQPNFAQQKTKPEPPLNDSIVPSKKYSIEAGLSTVNYMGYGVNFKADYLIYHTNVRNGSLGIAAILSEYKYGFSYKERHFKEYNFQPNPGYFASVFFTHSSRHIDKKHPRTGTQYTAGVGYTTWKSSYSSKDVNGLWAFSQDVTQHAISFRIGISSDFKVGPGSIYWEMPISIHHLISKKERIYNQTGEIVNPFHYSPDYDRELSLFSLGLNIGYRWTF